MKTRKQQVKRGAGLPAMNKWLLIRAHRHLVRLAIWLQRQTMFFSATKMKVILFAGCGAFLLLCSRVVYQSFVGQQPSIFVSRISVVPLQKVYESKTALLPPELVRVHHFILYLDSLGQTERGRVIRDSLLKTRPHLTDTLAYLEELYKSSIKK